MKNYKTMILAALLASFTAGCHHDNTQGKGPAAGVVAADTLAPTVSSTDPADATVDVSTNQVVTATFDESMDAATLTSLTVTLDDASGATLTPVVGAVTYVDNTVSFTLTPGSNLAVNSLYTATITTGVTDNAGNALAFNKVWSFTTASTMADTLAPTMISTNPADAATNVSTNQKTTAIFSEPMDPASLTAVTFTLEDANGGTPVAVAGTVTCIGSTAVFTLTPPGSSLAINTVYNAAITSGATDLAGNAFAGMTWSFTTGVDADTTAPDARRFLPKDTATQVFLNATPAVGFSEEMDPATINTGSFLLQETVSGTAVSGTVSSLGKIAIFDPAISLLATTQYTATITTSAMDLASNAMAADKTWSFTTGTFISANPAVVNLGASGAFAVLSKTGITSVPTSILTGDVGASPITGAAIGVTCAEVTGNIYSVDDTGPLPCVLTDATLLTTAVSDMETAYTDAAGRTLPDYTELGAGEIGGQSLARGLYKWSTDVSISTDVTLVGRASAVWIFQIDGNLVQADGIRINLVGGAQAKNVFWQVAGSTTLGTTAEFKGVLLCQSLIALNAGAVVNGSILSQTAVTLQSNTVTKQ